MMMSIDLNKIIFAFLVQIIGHYRGIKAIESLENFKDVNLNGYFSFDVQQLYVEVLVVVDDSVINFHGSNVIEQYILTQMSIVNDIYQHDSLGVIVNIIVTKILMINSKTENIIVNNDARATLEKFCNWANKKRNYSSNNTEMYFDIALYLTRNNFGPAGYASVTGMCVQERGCAIVKDDGASSAFVIAHEIGHIFGMIHDGHGNNCSSDASDGRIMASMVQSNYNLHFWSQCSKDTLLKHINEYHCLLDKPKFQLVSKYSQPFGQSWNLDEQCRQEFGADYNLCRAFDGIDPCKLLWCGIGSNSTVCKTKRGPPLPGTSCGRGKWCMDYECQNKSSISIDGNWSMWSTWGRCSKSCLFGVHLRSRICSNPRPSFGGKDCQGEDKEYRICNIQPCSENKDSRLEQCSILNKIRFDENRQHQWIPAENFNKKVYCKLTCISKEYGLKFVSDYNVVDGTLCSYDNENNICINGDCVEVGCDGNLNTTKKNDLCGICGGDSSECVKIKESLNSLLAKKEYNILVKIPSNARHIIIKEKLFKPHLASFLAIRDFDTEEWILNGGAIHSPSTSFVSHGTYFKYISSELDGEIITAKGPITSPIEIFIFSQSSKIFINVDYEYVIQKSYNNEKTNQQLKSSNLQNTERYEWALTGWSDCSKSCDAGFQTEQMICIDKRKQRIVRGFCSHVNKSESRRECNVRACPSSTMISLTTIPQKFKQEFPYWWQTKDWSVCSISCGNGGFQGRDVSCVTKDASGQIKAIQPAYCSSRNIPSYIKVCDYVSC